MTKKVAIAYIPVLHKGYYNFITELQTDGVEQLYLIGDAVLESHADLDYIHRKDRLRALPIQTVIDSLTATTTLHVQELSNEHIVSLQSSADVIVTPREDIGETIAREYFSDKTIEFRDISVRRNKLSVGEDRIPDVGQLSMTDFESEVWGKVFDEASKSTDWWRQVGAALVQDGEIIYVTHNEHMPEEQLPNIEGDTRALFKKGININYVTSAHAEVAAIATAAKHGVVTAGAELYTTDFPCPYCARLIAKAGIKKVYFIQGYAVLEGDEFLKGEGVAVIKIEV